MIKKLKQLFMQKFMCKGFFQIQFFDADTGKLLKQTKIIENTLTEVNRQYRQAMLDGTYGTQGLNISDLEIMYFAVGDGTTASSVSDTQLENERERVAVTALSSSGTDTTSVTVFSPQVANFRIREIGVFCGSSATSTANSGIMISRINVDFTKTANITMNVNRIDRTVI